MRGVFDSPGEPLDEGDGLLALLDDDDEDEDDDEDVKEEEEDATRRGDVEEEEETSDSVLEEDVRGMGSEATRSMRFCFFAPKDLIFSLFFVFSSGETLCPS